jgi:6-pyruvoyltetrahydropterin/6-carboxytetrahydropterin synthase
LLLHFVEELKDVFPEEMKLSSIRLEETPSSFAEWFANDN